MSHVQGHSISSLVEHEGDIEPTYAGDGVEKIKKERKKRTER